MSALPAGFSRDDARNLQKALNEKAAITPALVTDGLFGSKSVAALRTYQQVAGLSVTGEYDVATRTQLVPFIDAKYLKPSDFPPAAAELKVELAAMRAVSEVEAKGDGFLPDGKIKILFERHKFYAALGKLLPRAELDKLAAQAPDILNRLSGGYTLTREWERITKAFDLVKGIEGGEEAVYWSASWGMFQIMGFNHKQAGYASAKEMALDYAKSESVHLKSFVTFIKNDNNLLTALRAKDWARFAKGYNGSGYAANQYDVKMALAYTKFAR